MTKPEFVLTILKLVASKTIPIEDAEKFLQPNSSGPSRKLIDVLKKVNKIIEEKLPFQNHLEKLCGVTSIKKEDYNMTVAEALTRLDNITWNKSETLQKRRGLENIMTNLYSGKYYPVPDISSKCNHSWKSYQGFSENYDYCEKCDIKK